MRSWGFLGGLICASLAACSVGSPYRKPEIPLPNAWDATSRADNSAPVADQSAWPETDWWHRFGSAQLDDLIDQARRTNDDLNAAVARVQEADAQLRIAGAPLLPTADLGASATRERTATPGGGMGVYNVFSPVLTASYELDFWGKNRAARDAARALAVASRYDRETVALTVISSVATHLFASARAARAHRRRAAEPGERPQDSARARLPASKSARRPGLDVAQQETAVALLDAALPPLEQQFRQTVYALAVLVGKTPESLDVSDGRLTDLKVPQVVAGMPSELLMRRPDVAEAEQQLVSANADITVARAALFPSITLTASGGYESEVLSSLVNPVNRIYAVSAGLTQPIFHGGALRGQLAYSKARYSELLSGYHKTVLTALDNVEGALVAARQTTVQQERQAEAVAKARRAYEFAQAQMSAGTINVLTVLNTENALFSARDTLVEVQYSRLQALVDLYTALGGGWQEGKSG